MKTRFVEATQGVEGGFNHGKFMVGVFEASEWARTSELDWRVEERMTRLLGRCGWSRRHIFVADLQTGEGAMFLPGGMPKAVFLPGGMPKADLDKHRIWVCPMFEPFLGWLYDRVREGDAGVPGPKSEKSLDGEPTWFRELPLLVEIPGAAPSQFGYRRPGVEERLDSGPFAVRDLFYRKEGDAE